MRQRPGPDVLNDLICHGGIATTGGQEPRHAKRAAWCHGVALPRSGRDDDSTGSMWDQCGYIQYIYILYKYIYIYIQCMYIYIYMYYVY